MEVNPKALTEYEECFLGQLYQGQCDSFAAREKNLSEQAEYLQFMDALQKVEAELQNETSKVNVMMDIGCNIYTEAVISCSDRAVVDVGKGYYVEMSLREAKAFISRKLNLLKNIESMLSDNLAAAKTAYKLILGLKSVENFPLI